MKKLFAVITSVSLLPVGIFAQVEPNYVPAPPPAALGDPQSYYSGEVQEIVQLNNLRITSINWTTVNPAQITATYDAATRCMKFATESASAGTPMTCPGQMPEYQINVNNDTILLLRTRVRAKLSDFVVGDRINAYGFMDTVPQRSMDALIIRDLDRPEIKKTIQINDVVVTEVSSQTFPAVITVKRTQISPCLDYTAGAKGVLYPCPLGVLASGNIGSPMPLQVPEGVSYQWSPPPAETLPRMPFIAPESRYYKIYVNANTILYDRNRSVIKLASIEVGDRVNAYGVLRNDSATLDAQVVRDLSKPMTDASASLRVYVTATDSPCLAATINPDGVPYKYSEIPFPCRPLYNATVLLYGPNGTMMKQMTERGVAFFERLPVGNYTTAVTADGYQPMKQEVSVAAGAANTATITLTPNASNPGQGPTVTGVSGPTSLAVGEMGTWTVKAYDPNNGTLWYEVHWGDEVVPPPMPYASGAMPARDAFQQTSTFSHAYQRAGGYQPTFVVKSSNGQMVKTSTSVRVGDSSDGGGTISSLNIEPQAMRLEVGTSQAIHAYVYIQPSCPAGAYCAMMVRREEVFPQWTSSNPSVAYVATAQPMCITTPCNPITNVMGNFPGNAVLTATYTDASGKIYTGYAKVTVGGTIPTPQPTPTIGVNAPVTIPTYPPPVGTFVTNSRDSIRLTAIRSIQLALELYYDMTGWYPTELSLLVPKLLSMLPKDPVDDTLYIYKPLPDGCQGSSTNPCTKYHMGANFETLYTPYISQDADKNTTLYSGGFSGLDYSSCIPGVGVRYCYDVTPDMQ